MVWITGVRIWNVHAIGADYLGDSVDYGRQATQHTCDQGGLSRYCYEDLLPYLHNAWILQSSPRVLSSLSNDWPGDRCVIRNLSYPNTLNRRSATAVMDIFLWRRPITSLPLSQKWERNVRTVRVHLLNASTPMYFKILFVKPCSIWRSQEHTRCQEQISSTLFYSISPTPMNHVSSYSEGLNMCAKQGQLLPNILKRN